MLGIFLKCSKSINERPNTVLQIFIKFNKKLAFPNARRRNYENYAITNTRNVDEAQLLITLSRLFIILRKNGLSKVIYAEVIRNNFWEITFSNLTKLSESRTYASHTILHLLPHFLQFYLCFTITYSITK